MKQLLIILAALVTTAGSLLPGAAHAGVGTSAGTGGYLDGTAYFPTLDYRAGGVLVQIHVLDQLQPFTSKGSFYLNTGADVTYVAIKKKVGPEVEGVFMPGGGLRVADQGDLHFNLMAEARMGAEMKQGMGFGMYIVPALGLSSINSTDNKIHLNYGGALQVSAWFVK